MQKIIVNNTEIHLTRQIQTSPTGREFIFSATLRNTNPAKWIDRVEKWHYTHIFIYQDTQELFGFEFDYNDKFYQKHNDLKIKELLKQ